MSQVQTMDYVKTSRATKFHQVIKVFHNAEGGEYKTKCGRFFFADNIVDDCHIEFVDDIKGQICKVCGG